MNLPPPHRPLSSPPSRHHRAAGWLCLWLAAAGAASAPGWASAADVAVPANPGLPALGKIPLPARPVNQTAASTQESTKPETSARGEKLREAIEKANSAESPASAPRPGAARKAPAATPQFTFTVPPDNKSAPVATQAGKASKAGKTEGEAAASKRTEAPSSDDEANRQYIRARAAALGAFATTPQAAAAVGMRAPSRGNGNADSAANRKPAPGAPGAPPPWSYEGAAGPLSWGQLKPEFATCATGQRQSPIAIDDDSALQGPAEPLRIDYKPGTGAVTHTGRTLQVDVQGDNTLTVRGTRYRLERVEFHHPAEERINGKGFAMSAHLLHRSADGQLATVAVLLEPGTASPAIDQIVTYLPLDVDDRVGLPPAGLDLAALLPQDPRYYQLFGSLTTPPCTEDVLWIIFKQPMTVSAAQLKLFGQLFPNNARPLQPANGRVVRAAQ